MQKPKAMPTTWAQIKELFETLKYRTVRDNILSGKPRIDGRLPNGSCLRHQVGVLPYTHGSALFTAVKHKRSLPPRLATAVM